MYKIFLKPIKIIFVVYILGGLSIASDVAQLTSFNLLDFLKENSPQSYWVLFAGTLLLYFILIIIGLISSKQSQDFPTPERNGGQFISTGNVKNSTINQIRKD